ncbi:MAG TPA: hypothetical protein VFC56_09890 [Stellaceae bacterium]|nr:hypothetical protein [Stellaceae bacterium]
MHRLTPEEIEAASRAIITARESSMGIEINTPVIYPNGQCVTVTVTMEGGEYVVHDAGLGAMYLTAEGVRMSRQLGERLAAMAARYECEFIDGRMMRRCSSDDVAIAAMLVANASRTVGDQAVEVRRQSEGEFRYAVSERLHDLVGSRWRENQLFQGASGRSYRISSLIMDETETAPIAFVFPLPSRSAVPAQFTEMYDLRAAFPRIANDSVYNDAGDFRVREDGWLLEKVSVLIPFSEMQSRLPTMLATRAVSTLSPLTGSRPS